MKKRSIVCLMVAALIGSSVVIPVNNIQEETITVSAAVYDTVPEGYTGIYTINDLYAVRNDLSGNYILMNDIDMSETAPGGEWDSGNGWEPIGSYYNEFKGNLYGNGYKIRNMHIYGDVSEFAESADNEISVGLFGYVSYGTILDLGIVDCDINITVNNTGNTKVNVGTTVGYYTAQEYDTVSGGGMRAEVVAAYSTGKITCESANAYTGAIVGGDRKLVQCYYLKDNSNITAGGKNTDSKYTDVKSLTSAQAKSQAAYNFDFDEIWTIDPNAEYPYPTLINVPYVSTQSSIVEPTQPTTNPSISTGTKKGDMNGDGLVDAVDASLILSYYAYLSTGGTIDDIDEWMQNG
ncbi:MAG: hypothetical protein K2I80_07090 [Ruminococcus sp.]|nr:hypothetical protein [Ruminococcus sp.]